MRRCLILGVNGQDGSFLADELINEGSLVEGWGKQDESRYCTPGEHFQYRKVDLRDLTEVSSALRDFNPDEIYHVAAVHGPAGFEYETAFGSVIDVNTKVVWALLEFARLEPDQVRLFYGSSAKVFGGLEGAVTIDTPRKNECLYSISKNTSENLIQYYRKRHSVKASVAVLFNHESSRRSTEFFIPKLCAGIRRLKEDPEFVLSLYTLDFFCDWGCAKEFMRICIDSLRVEQPSTFLLATGETISGEALAKQLFLENGLDFESLVTVNEAVSSSSKYEVDLSRLEELTGVTPQIDSLALCRRLIHDSID